MNGYEIRVPIFEHDPENGVECSEWTNDCWGQDGTLHDSSIAEITRWIDGWMAEDRTGEESLAYVRIYDQDGAMVRELVYDTATGQRKGGAGAPLRG